MLGINAALAVISIKVVVLGILQIFS